MASSEKSLIAKLRSLPPQRLTEVEDFIDFLHAREETEQLARLSAKASEQSFASVWDNDDDAAYDKL